ncbi:zinc ribbon domain-containing protein [Natrialbaceae archaeon GCM10025810]|uniref:zinc ribbon domain-containing protein n=1 Tax=Halovalidus salilacus TaxID=3075124 RepID=UPI00361C6CBB
MDDPGTLTTLWRLSVAAFVMVTPSLLFLGLVRGLERLRDDAFVDRWLTEQGHEIQDDVLTVLGTSLDSATGSDEGSTVRCPSCETSNAAGASICHGCLNRLQSR